MNAIISYREFCKSLCQRQLRRRMSAQLDWRDRLRFHLSASATLRNLKQRLTGHPLSLLYEQLTRLPDDLSGVDFQRDVLDPLSRWEGEAESANAPCIAGPAWAESPVKHQAASSARGRARHEL